MCESGPGCSSRFLDALCREVGRREGRVGHDSSHGLDLYYETGRLDKWLEVCPGNGRSLCDQVRAPGFLNTGLKGEANRVDVPYKE
ncbi:unnamed protein product [Protopolystoma xenopodis]|uniref:Uncharacterized protein n=1 Tax=Protopolystoma xenopodis TaxID=117903 RepID=A0A3S5C9G8_9PLAT|nr:unnamed protein product [Protopolystoma xenopodis]